MLNKSLQKEVKSKSGVLTEGEFFQKLVERSGYMDPKQVKQVYFAMKDIIFDELKLKGGVELPELCFVYLSKSKAKVIKNRFMSQGVKKEAHHQVRMVPKRSMKDYFKQLEAFYEGRDFDPGVRAGIK